MKQVKTVTLRDEYDGYFREYKGIELTIDNVFKRDGSIDSDCITVLEIPELHLIKLSNFKVVSYEVNN